MSNEKQTILDGNAVLGIEFGSTRIKAVLVGENHTPIASGAHDWENQLVNGIWTYSLEAVWEGLQDCCGRCIGKIRCGSEKVKGNRLFRYDARLYGI